MRKPRAPRPQASSGEPEQLPPHLPPSLPPNLTPAAKGARPGQRGARAVPPQGRSLPPTRGGRPRRTVSSASSSTSSSANNTASRTPATPASGVPKTARPQKPAEDGEHSAPSSELTVFGRRAAVDLRSQSRKSRGPAVISTGLTDRLAERRQALMRLRMRKVAIAAVVLVVVAALSWALLFSPLLALRTNSIQVAGSDGTVLEAQVQEILAPYQGRSLLRLDMAKLSEQVAGDLVRVRSAQVTRDWPRGLSVNLVMRVPVAVRHTASGVEVLDGDAVVLEVVSTAPQGLVTIVADARSAQDTASGGALSAEQVTAVSRVVGALEESVRGRVVSGSATDTGQVTLTLSDGSAVVWGASDPQTNAHKAKVLAVLLQTPAAVYDVSAKSPTTSQTPLPRPSLQGGTDLMPAPAPQATTAAPEAGVGEDAVPTPSVPPAVPDSVQPTVQAAAASQSPAG